MATITGNPLYAVAAYIIIAGGGIIFIVSFLGCCGAMTENRLMLLVCKYHASPNFSFGLKCFTEIHFTNMIIYMFVFLFQFCATLVFIFFILFIGAVLAIVFRSQVSISLKVISY